jgi:hypothetical protein
MENQIKITSTDQIIEFIKETDLPLSDYRKIIDSYSGSKFFAAYKRGHTDFTATDKENLISLVKSKADSIENGHPVFFAMGEPEGAYQNSKKSQK